MQSHLLILSVVAIVFGVGGCFRAVLRTPTEVGNSNEDDIVISTKDGRQISFESHKYNLISDENGRQVIRGEGKMYRQGESQFESFEGSIPVDEIERISTSEKTTMFYVTIAAAALAVGYVLLWTIALNGRGFGG